MPGGGDPLELAAVPRDTDPAAIKAAPFIEGWLRDIGIDVSTKTMTDSKLYDHWYGFDWDLIIYSWGVGPDPDFILSSFTSDQCGYWSDTCYANPEYDGSTRSSRVTLDETERQAIVHEMQQMIYRDTPEIVLWYPNSFEAWRSDRWTGLRSAGPSPTVRCSGGTRTRRSRSSRSPTLRRRRRRQRMPGRGLDRWLVARRGARRRDRAAPAPPQRTLRA